MDPDQDLHERAPPFPSDLCAMGVREGHSDFGFCSHTSFESLRAPRAPAGRKPRTSQPTLCGRQEVRERSLCNRYPRSLAALETTELLTRVKQVGSSRSGFSEV